MRLHDFLAIVADLDDHPVRPHRNAPAIFRPAAALLVAAALIAAVVLTPGVVRHRPPEGSTNLAAPAGSTATSGASSNSTGTTAGSPATSDSLTVPPAFTDRSITSCPTGVPRIEVRQVVTGTTTTVTGVITNASSSPLAVTAFTVIATVGGLDLPGVPGATAPIDVGPSSTTTWSATLPATPPAGTTVRANLDQWEWRGDATGCATA
jgi:hypothetical protein